MASHLKGLKDSRTFAQSTYSGKRSRGEAPVVDERAAHEKLQEEVNEDVASFIQAALGHLPNVISGSIDLSEQRQLINDDVDGFTEIEGGLPEGVVVSPENLAALEKARALHRQAVTAYKRHEAEENEKIHEENKKFFDEEFDLLLPKILDAKKRIHGVRVFAQRTSLDELRKKISEFELEYHGLVEDISHFLHGIREYDFEETEGTKDMEHELVSVHQELSILSEIYTRRNAPSTDQFHERFEKAIFDDELSIIEERIVGFQDATNHKKWLDI